MKVKPASEQISARSVLFHFSIDMADCCSDFQMRDFPEGARIDEVVEWEYRRQIRMTIEWIRPIENQRLLHQLTERLICDLVADQKERGCFASRTDFF